jgi:hypothetical protein
MAGQFDYTVNIPQPPAQNFLQSLLGIQQLKGLQQQQDIQGQQAQFAQQMQPLQIQTEQARLEQVVQAKEAGAENLRQSKITFEQSQAAKEQTKQLFGELQGMSANAPIEDVVKITNKLALINPPAAKQVNDNYNKLLEQYQNNVKIISTQAGSLLEAGKYQDAADLYNEAAKAVRDKAGNNQNLLNLEKGYEIQAKLCISNPVAAKTGIATLLGVIDPQALNAITAYSKENAKGEAEKNLPGPILKDNLAIQKKVDAADEMASKLSQAANSIRNLEPTSDIGAWWTEVKQRTGFTQPEIAIRNNASQLAGLGMLGQENAAMGGAIRSNVQFQYATGKLPSAWNSPQDLAKRLDIQSEVQQRISKLMAIDSEWNSAFIGKPKATKPETIMGIDVARGTSISDFKKTAAELLFPKDEELPTGVSQTNKTEPAPRKKTGLPPAANNIFRTNIGGKSITVELE